MKYITIIAAVALLTACGASFDASRVQHGMTPNELVAAVGEPDQKLTLGLTEVWKYDKAGITFKGGQVDACIHDYQLYMEKVEVLNDSIDKLMEQQDSMPYEEWQQRMEALGAAAEKLGQEQQQ